MSRLSRSDRAEEKQECVADGRRGLLVHSSNGRERAGGGGWGAQKDTVMALIP